MKLFSYFSLFFAISDGSKVTRTRRDLIGQNRLMNNLFRHGSWTNGGQPTYWSTGQIVQYLAQTDQKPNWSQLQAMLGQSSNLGTKRNNPRLKFYLKNQSRRRFHRN